MRIRRIRSMLYIGSILWGFITDDVSCSKSPRDDRTGCALVRIVGILEATLSANALC